MSSSDIWFMAAVSLRLLGLLFWWSISSLRSFTYLYSIGLATSVSSSWDSIGVVVTYLCPTCTHRISGQWWSGTHFQLYCTKRVVNLAKGCKDTVECQFQSPSVVHILTFLSGLATNVLGIKAD